MNTLTLARIKSQIVLLYKNHVKNFNDITYPYYRILKTEVNRISCLDTTEVYLNVCDFFRN